MLSGLNSCIIKKILDIADTCNISTSKDPFISLSWAIGTETSNLRIPSSSQIQNILTIVIDRRKCGRSIPSSPGPIGSEILQCSIPVFRCISYCKSKTIWRTECQIGLACGFKWIIGFGVPCSLFFGSYVNISVTRMRRRSCTNTLRSNKLRSRSGDFLFIRIGEVVSSLYRSAAIRASRTLLALNSLRTLFALQSSKLLGSEIRISESIALVTLISLRPLSSVCTRRTLLTGIAFRTLDTLLALGPSISLFALQIGRARARCRSDRKNCPYPFVSDRYAILTIGTCGALSTSVALFALRTLFTCISLGSLNALLSLGSFLTGIALIAFLSL